MTEEEILRELRSCFDSEGRLRLYPTKRRKKLLVQRYLAGKVEPGRRYTEREMNELLNRWHTFGDHCLLRRELYDSGFLDRERDGSVYWLASESVWPAISG